MTESERAAAEFAAKTRAFGLTHGDMEIIREEQIHGTTKMIPANNAISIPDEVFKSQYEGYQIPWHEEMHYHIALEARLWDTSGATPTRLSQSHVQVYTRADYELMINMKPTNGFNGYVTHILHNPDYVKVKTAAKKVEVKALPADLAALTTTKEAKAFYKTLTGLDPTRVWSLEKTIAAIQEFQNTQNK